MSEPNIQPRQADNENGSPPVRNVTPRVDVYETSEHYRALFDVPGATLESVSLEVEGRQLRVQATRPLADTRRAERFTRTLELPAELGATDVTATLVDGVLDVTIAKRAAQTKVVIPVTVH
jgi:HSP20 family molecular chaperone IbpA